jgi:hypothetical protein
MRESIPFFCIINFTNFRLHMDAIVFDALIAVITFYVLTADCGTMTVKAVKI